MTIRDTPFAPGTPSWVDLSTSDAGKATAFYTGLFGWTAESSGPEYGGYVTLRSDGHRVAGLIQKDADAPFPDAWSTYISTVDIDASVAAATEAGAGVMMPVLQVGEMGAMAVLTDPAGAVFGLWKADSHTGFSKYNEPGSVTWDELQSKDFAAATAFYQKVFGWTYKINSDTDEFRYSEGQIDGQTVAGVMDSAGYLPAEVPSHWAVYFSVEDTDEAVAKVTELGGSVSRPAEDTPFGRIADVADPTGATFKLHSIKLANPAS